jgi:hypothetical protein
MTNLYKNTLEIFKTALPPAFKTIRWLLSLMIPISLIVTLLQYYGIISLVADLLNPIFELIGLSGQCAFVFLTSIFLNIYSAIAVISSLSLSSKEITILAVMCLISHNMIIETIIQKKTGSSAIQMVMVRLLSSILCAFVLNQIIESDIPQATYVVANNQNLSLLNVLQNWLINIFFLSLKVMMFVTILMILQKFLEKSGIIEIISKLFAPFLKIMGLPAKTSFLWIVSNVLGFAYSSAIIFDELEKGKLSKEEINLLNYHVSISHSLLEDTLLFFAIGVSLFWLIIPRLILAIIAVWLYKFLNYKILKYIKN